MRALLITIIWASLGLSNTSLAETRLTVGVALPRAQLGQGNGASADVAEPVRQALMSYLKGPKIEVIALANSGKIRMLVEHFGLDDAADAYQLLHDGRIRGRAVITPHD